jgi:hypothetical protein
MNEIIIHTLRNIFINTDGHPTMIYIYLVFVLGIIVGVVLTACYKK